VNLSTLVSGIAFPSRRWELHNATAMWNLEDLNAYSLARPTVTTLLCWEQQDVWSVVGH
jgi:hypothetical protein